VVSTTTIASLAGFSGTLGDIINNEASYHLYGVIGAAICIAALALVIEVVLASVQRVLTPRGLILAGERESSLELEPAVA
jgi:osmoprotectant transport system permease protein